MEFIVAVMSLQNMSLGNIFCLKRPHTGDWRDVIHRGVIEKQFVHTLSFLVTAPTTFCLYPFCFAHLYGYLSGPWLPIWRSVVLPALGFLEVGKCWTLKLIRNLNILRWYFKFKEHWGINILLWSIEHWFSLWFFSSNGWLTWNSLDIFKPESWV